MGAGGAVVGGAVTGGEVVCAAGGTVVRAGAPDLGAVVGGTPDVEPDRTLVVVVVGELEPWADVPLESLLASPGGLVVGVVMVEVFDAAALADWAASAK